MFDVIFLHVIDLEKFCFFFVDSRLVTWIYFILNAIRPAAKRWSAAEKTDEKHQKLEVMFHPWMYLI